MRDTGKYLPGVIAWVIAAIYLIPFVERGWMPHDEGLLAHSAERVLYGELPHRDFDDAYTGGLAMFHAASFRLGGVTTSAIRWTLYLAAILWIPLLYLIALRLAAPVIAALAVLACVAWSLPNYFAAMPSWYLLFLTTGSLYCLIRFQEQNGRRWLLAAGLCCGLSLLTKINGLYSIAAALLYILFVDQQRSIDASGRRSPAVAACTTLIALTFTAIVALLVLNPWSPDRCIHFVLPAAAVASVLVANEWQTGRGSFMQRSAPLLSDVFLFLGGCSLPVAAFLIPYVLSDSVHDLLYGLFVLPQRRMESAALEFPPLYAAVCTIPTALFLLRQRTDQTVRTNRQVTAAICLLLATLLVFSVGYFWHHAIWLSARMLVPFVVAGGAWWLLRPMAGTENESKQRATLFLLLASTTLLSLLQFPFAANIYFCYFAPLLILAAVGVRQMIPLRSESVAVVVLVFYLAFPIVSLNQGFLAFHSEQVAHSRSPFTLERSSLHVSPQHRETYEQIIALIDANTSPNSTIYAAPDCPEIYFLSGRSNPTRTMYDFFDDPAGRNDRIAEMLDKQNVQCCVVNMQPLFSSKMDKTLQREIQRRFPRLHSVGPFVVAFPDSSTPDSPLPRRAVADNGVSR